MARDTRRRFYSEINRLQPSVRSEFIQAFNDISQSVNLDLIVLSLERGDIEGALSALRVNTPVYAPLQEALRNVFIQGGAYTTETLPIRNPATNQQIIFRFDGRHPSAESFLRTQSSALITRLSDTQVRVAREVLSTGLQAGRAPRSVALDLVGRVGSGRRRTGGIIGLTEPQSQFLIRLRERLASEGLPEDQIVRMVRAETNKKLRQRGETIARTETLPALGQGRAEAVQQLIDSGQVSQEAVTHSWSVNIDGRERFTHNGMQGQSRPFDEPFVSPSGAFLMRPGDTSLGAPPEEIINCRCFENININYFLGVT